MCWGTVYCSVRSCDLFSSTKWRVWVYIKLQPQWDSVLLRVIFNSWFRSAVSGLHPVQLDSVCVSFKLFSCIVVWLYIQINVFSFLAMLLRHRLNLIVWSLYLNIISFRNTLNRDWLWLKDVWFCWRKSHVYTLVLKWSEKYLFSNNLIFYRPIFFLESQKYFWLSFTV